ncbi:MAG: choice-of-anchor Q domain-containing protein [Rudaea sp.]
MSTMPGVSRLLPLAAVCIGLFAASTEDAFALLPVTNCANIGSGSLRASVASAVSGDKITIPSSINCSTISLTTGAITIPAAVANLTIVGPGADALMVRHGYGSPPDRVFDHQGTGTFTVQALSVAYGNPTATSYSVDGGCIRSSGRVTLLSAQVSYCRANGTGSAGARGGGIYADKVNVKYSTMSQNDAIGTSFVRGGAIYSQGLFAKYSNITRNSAYSSGSAFFLGSGGGIYNTNGAATITGSNVSYNATSGSADGISEFISGTAVSLQISNSTISHNYAGHTIGGVYSDAPTTIHNSTIAFNSAAQDYTGSRHHAPGLHVEEDGYAITLDLVSSILSNNTYGAINDDISIFQTASYPVTLTGSNNLIYSNFPSTPVPGGTIRFACPLLGPLRDNGGVTQTLALLSHSPAIDTGSNPFAFDFDQRQGPYARMSGANPDIGAYEVQQADIVFNTSFEGCPVVF